MKYPALISVKNKKVYPIKETPFYVGSHPSCDVCIKNDALDWVHFGILSLREEGCLGFQLIDQGGKNTTSLKNSFVKGFSQESLTSNSVIRAANELFIFVEGDDEVVLENKGLDKSHFIRRLRFESMSKSRTLKIPERVNEATANDYFISYMNNETVDEAVFLVYETPSSDTQSKKIMVCAFAKEYKDNVKKLRKISGTTERAPKTKVAALKMADDCELEIFSSNGKKIDDVSFCWNGQIFFKEFEVSVAEETYLIKLSGADNSAEMIEFKL